jgi:type I restriction enzyme S subunit
VITIKGAEVGVAAQIPRWLDGANISQTNARLAISPAKANPRYVLHFLLSPLGRFEVYQHTKIGAQPGLIFEDIASFNVPMPPDRKWQDDIVAIFDLWDGAIEKIERLAVCSRERFRGLHQRLYAISSLNEWSWPTASLSQISDRVRSKNDGADHPVMTISGKARFLRQDEKFSRFMAGESVENYTLLKRGEFSYNKGNSKTYPQGCIYRLEQETALVPNVYISFRLHEGQNADFYAALFQSGFLNRQLARIINSGVRNDGLLNLNVADFFGCNVPVPPADEQARIASMVATAKQELRLLDRQAELLKRQKHSLMRRLLTGELRAPVRDSYVDAMADLVTEEAAQ